MSPHKTKPARSQLSRFSFFKITILATFTLVLLLWPQNGHAIDVALAWDPNTEVDLDGYEVFSREEGETYSYDHPAWAGDKTETTCTIYSLSDDSTYYFVARAVDDEGNESGDSNEVQYSPSVSTDTAPDTSSNTIGATTTSGDQAAGCFIVTAAD